MGLIQSLLNNYVKIQAYWEQTANKFWLQPNKLTRVSVLLICLATLIACGLNYYVRASQYQKWESHPEIFYLEDGTPLFTTTDAPYFLGISKDLKDDGKYNSFYKKQLYNYQKQNWKDKENLRDIPLLSILLSFIATDNSEKSLLKAGNLIIPITAIITTLMIIFAFGAAGYWLEGTVAAAGGGMSLAYLQRSGAGRIDTDQLNLGFFYLMTGLVIVAARSKSFRGSLVLAALAGTVFWVFDWWYSKPFFGWAFFIAFIWISVVCGSNFRRIILQSALFLILSGLPFKGTGISGDSAYLNDVLLFDELIFPNTQDTITELSKISITDILIRISGSVLLGWVSILGLMLWGLRHPAYAIVFGPAAAFALLNFLIGNRAIFYSAPMLWFGFGWLALVLVKWIEHRFFAPQFRHSVSGIVVLAIFTFVWAVSPTDYLQAPTFKKNTINHFQNLKEILPENNAVLATWWDYGYMSMFMNGMPTLHDGGAQTTPTTHLLANNLLKSDQSSAAIELQLLSDRGYKGLLRARKDQKTLSDTNFQKQKQADVFLILTKDMARWMPAISKIGAFDIQKGKPYKFDGVNPNYQLRYDHLNCNPSSVTGSFLCNGNRLRMATGQFGDRAILHAVSVAKGGKQAGARRFPMTNIPFVVHSEMGVGAPINMLIHRDLYLSVFHQLFYLNNADSNYFTLIYDGFPDMRVFKIF